MPDRVERLLEVIKDCSSDCSAVHCCEELRGETKELQGCGVTTSKPDWKGEIKLLAERKFERDLFTRDSNTFVTDDNREIGR